MSYRWLLPILCLLLGACGHAPPRQTNPLAQWEPSPNFDERRPIVIVIHATEQESVARSLRTLSTRNLTNGEGGCGECQTSCQSACKTSCGVANQPCENL